MGLRDKVINWLVFYLPICRKEERQHSAALKRGVDDAIQRTKAVSALSQRVAKEAENLDKVLSSALSSGFQLRGEIKQDGKSVRHS